jgi:hypothetical protein
MRTQAHRRYESGFVLNEQELRRIHDVADQQMKRAFSDDMYEAVYEMRFENGAIAEPKNLDEVFAQENWGSAGIRLVRLTFRARTQVPSTGINVTFADTKATEDAKGSISYEIEGEDRDWVFVASSQLSERIARIQCLNVRRVLRSEVVSVVGMLLFLFAMMASAMFTHVPGHDKAIQSV